MKNTNIIHPKEKIISSLEELSNRCEILKSRGETLVLTGGCFDLLHGGHLQYVWDAANFGSVLIVGISSDVFVKQRKGKTRPIRKEADRAFTMAGFYPVTLVTTFSDDCDLITAVKPDYFIVYSPFGPRVQDSSKRSQLLKHLETQVIEITSSKMDSTTDIIDRAARLFKNQQ